MAFRIPVLCRTVALLIVTVLVSETECRLLESCPCTIDINMGTADCFSRNLTEIPACIPTAIQSMDLAYNNLRYHPNQFQGFNNLTFLDLSYNRAFAPENDSFTGLSKLKTLYLNFTSLTYLPSGVFAGLTTLEKLSLTTVNSMGRFYLPQNIFTGISNLTHLSIRNNSQLTVGAYQFEGLNSLRHLDLSNNNDLRPLDSNTFIGLSSVKFLSLKNSFWFTNDTPSTVFEAFVSLEELHLEGFCYSLLLSPNDDCSNINEHMSRVPSLKRLYIHNTVLETPIGQGFSFLRHLEELSFIPTLWFIGDHCRIKNLSTETFQHLKGAPLTKLSIHHCDIEFISKNVFSELIHLKSLDLVLTAKWCNDHFFCNFATGIRHTKLNRLRFSANCLFRVSDDRTEPLMRGLMFANLDYLDLSNGPIEKIDYKFKFYLPKTLKYLYLQRNKISNIYPGTFYHFKDLKILDLSNQADISADLKTARRYLQRTSELTDHRHITLDCPNDFMYGSNTHTAFEMQETDANWPSFQLCRPLPFSLESINVSNSGLLCNMIENFCGSNFSLKILNIAYQKNFDCARTFWKVLRKLNLLEELDLRGNNIRELPSDVFSQQRKLNRLFLADNVLLEISFDIKSLISLHILDLASNTIQYASSKFIEQMKDITQVSNLSVYLQNNRLRCDCERIDFLAWIRDSSSIANKNNLTCKYVNGTMLSLDIVSEIHYFLENQCIVLEVTVSCVSGFVLSNLVLCIVALIWYSRWKVKYLLSVGRSKINPYHPLEEREIQLEYDVYISFDQDFNVTPTETLREFVTRKIYPGLKRKGFRVLIREDFDGGMRLYEVISKTLRKCDKVVALLSKKYCYDYWNVFEFNIAVMEGIYTKRQVLVPVTFESLGRADLHEEIHTFLSAQPVPVYTRNLTDSDFIDYLSEKIRDNKPFD